MTRGTEPENCNIDNIDEYHVMRDDVVSECKSTAS